jgi:hypothetical protein
MIEKYFRTGIRFKWTKPRDAIGPLDGTIIDSTQTATPLIYDGLDGQLKDPHLMQVNVSTLGLTMRMPIQYAWLDYAPGRTARVPIGPYDVLTGYMSGCIIAYWSSKGVRFAGHVGTIDARPDVNRPLKRTFAFAMSPDAKGFNPLAAWPEGQIRSLAQQVKPYPQSNIFGLVTANGAFYSILMLSLSNNEWIVGGIKSVPPISHDQLKMMMVRDD